MSTNIPEILVEHSIQTAPTTRAYNLNPHKQAKLSLKINDLYWNCLPSRCSSNCAFS